MDGPLVVVQKDVLNIWYCLWMTAWINFGGLRKTFYRAASSYYYILVRESTRHKSLFIVYPNNGLCTLHNNEFSSLCIPIMWYPHYTVVYNFFVRYWVWRTNFQDPPHILEWPPQKVGGSLQNAESTKKNFSLHLQKLDPPTFKLVATPMHISPKRFDKWGTNDTAWPFAKHVWIVYSLSLNKVSFYPLSLSLEEYDLLIASCSL